MLFLDGILFSLFSQPSMAFALLEGVAGALGALILVVIGILIIVLVVGVLLVLLPAIIVAIIVWFLTGNFFYAGIAFLVVAIISLVAI